VTKLKTAQKIKIRIGKISYLNCLPYFHNFSASDDFDAEYLETYPSKLNLALRQGKIDLGPISSLEYLNHQNDYVLLPSLAIGSRDFSGSVTLFSHKKIEDLNGETIALSRQSLSSATLLRILLKFKYKYENKFVSTSHEPDELINQYPAFLLIGDQALYFQSKKFVYKYDLSELWWNWTRKPFCFAVWAVRREFALKNHDAVLRFASAMKEHLGKNLEDIESLILNGLQMDFLNVRFSKVFGYLFNLVYELDDSMCEGLELFFRLAKRLGVSPKPKRIEFLGAEEPAEAAL